jgi:putative endonuclease
VRGCQAEQQASHYLRQQGLCQLAGNYRCRCGEIDLIMEHGEVVVFVEVRYRRNTRHGSGAESITRHKQRKLIRAAQHYLQRHPDQAQRPCRFDVISLCGESNSPVWIQDAFQADA